MPCLLARQLRPTTGEPAERRIKALDADSLKNCATPSESAAGDDDEGASAHPEPADAPHRLLELYDGALPVVYGYFVRRCADRGTAEDLTSETFLAAMDAARRPDPPLIAVPWLLGVAWHKLPTTTAGGPSGRPVVVADVPDADAADGRDAESTGSWPRACCRGFRRRTAPCWRCATWTIARCSSAPG
jgi:hypothetical protein